MIECIAGVWSARNVLREDDDKSGTSVSCYAHRLAQSLLVKDWQCPAQVSELYRPELEPFHLRQKPKAKAAAFHNLLHFNSRS